MQQVIELAQFYLGIGYSIDDAITTAINVIREKEIDLYENKGGN